MGKHRKLTARQIAEVRERYRLFVANRPNVIAKQFGISPRAISDYVRGRHKLRTVQQLPEPAKSVAKVICECVDEARQ